MRVMLTGGRGMVGQAILRLASQYAPHWIIFAPSSRELDLMDRVAVQQCFQKHQFDLVIHLAAKVGGIRANMADPTAFLSNNLLINTHVIEEARHAGVSRLINLGSSCMYPRNYRNPLLESDLLAAPLESTNEGYAISKIAAERLCAYISDQYRFAYRTLIPCNLYGPGDHFDLNRGHLIAAAILKIHNAKREEKGTVEIWGDGKARREFMFVDDLARFILTCVDHLEGMPVRLNTGIGIDYSVNDYYAVIAEVIGYNGEFIHNLDAPVGMWQKLMDSTLAGPFGWVPVTHISEGIKKTYEHFLSQHSHQENAA